MLRSFRIKTGLKVEGMAVKEDNKISSKNKGGDQARRQPRKS